MASKVETQQSWKRRSSEIRGFERAMYVTLGNGDYLRVDYNLGESVVRVYAEVVADQGVSYYSIIKNGRVNVEKNSTGKSAKVAERLKERADDFSTLPNVEVLRLINNNYGISSNNISEKKSKKEQLAIEREEVKRRYFGPEDQISARNSIYSKIGLKKVGFIDLLDTVAGMLLAGLFFYLSQYSFQIAGAVAALWGIMLGIIDIFLRGRDPFFLKILFFLISGTGIYIYNYLYL